MSIVISSGHGKFVRGASSILDEVDEAIIVVDNVAKYATVDVTTFHDNISTTQQENLERIVSFHNDCKRDLDVSVHFNCYEYTESPMGCEVLYVTEQDLAKKVCDAICKAGGFINRGAKYRDDLYFLNQTEQPSILIEVCFVDSVEDAELYDKNFVAICKAIAKVLSGGEEPFPAPEEPEASEAPETFHVKGKASWFGGPKDTGVSASEGLALPQSIDEAPQLFLPYQPDNTTGLARRLNPYVHYLACRWNYEETPRDALLSGMALVRAIDTGIELLAFPADWGPNENTGRVADLSPTLLYDLGLKTDGEVEVIFPAPQQVMWLI